MKLILVTAALFGIFISTEVQKKLSITGQDLQRICNEMLPSDSEHVGTIASLVCGEKVTNTQSQKILQTTGLIHIFVVSGGHLIVVAEILNALRCPPLPRLIFLSFFTLFTGFQIPCLRSLLQLFLSEWTRAQGIYLRIDQKVLLCGVLILLLFPHFTQSLSLQLSWGAALALSLAHQIFKKNNFIIKALTAGLLVYGIMFPLLSPLAGLSPVTILWNLAMGPLMTFALFPLCALATVNIYALQILELCMPLVWTVLDWAHDQTPSVTPLNWNLYYGWAWIFICHGCFHVYLVYHLRKHAT